VKGMQTGRSSALIVACFILAAVPAAAQLRPDLAQEQTAIEARLQELTFTVQQSADVFRIPDGVRILRFVGVGLALSTDGQAALDEWIAAHHPIIWVDRQSAWEFGYARPARGPGFSMGATMDMPPAPQGVVAEPLLAEGVKRVYAWGSGIPNLPEGAVPLVRVGDAVLCAEWPYAGTRVLLLDEGRQGAPSFDVRSYDGPRLWFNLEKWLLAQAEGETPAAAEEAAPPKVREDAEGCVTCPHCGQKMKVEPAP